MVHRRPVQAVEEQMGLAGNLATVPAGFAPVDTNPFLGVRLTSAFGYVLRRSSERHGRFDPVEEAKFGDRS